MQTKTIATMSTAELVDALAYYAMSSGSAGAGSHRASELKNMDIVRDELLDRIATASA